MKKSFTRPHFMPHNTLACSNSVTTQEAIHKVYEQEMKFEVRQGSIDPNTPLLYMWEIRDQTGALMYCYVGKSERGIERPLQHYKRNVHNLLGGRPYRRGKPDRFRVVHRKLAEAVSHGHHITLVILCNVPPGANIYEWERQAQIALGC